MKNKWKLEGGNFRKLSLSRFKLLVVSAFKLCLVFIISLNWSPNISAQSWGNIKGHKEDGVVINSDRSNNYGNLALVTGSNSAFRLKNMLGSLVFAYNSNAANIVHGFQNDVYLMSIDGAGNMTFRDDADIKGIDRIIGHNDLRFSASPNSGINMLLNEDGNLGIGTQSPSGKLHVDGAVNLGSSPLRSSTALFVNNFDNHDGLVLKKSGDGDGDPFIILDQYENQRLKFDHHGQLSVGIPATDKVKGVIHSRGSLHIEATGDHKTVLHVTAGDNANNDKGRVFVGSGAFHMYNSAVNTNGYANSEMVEQNYRLWVSEGIVTEDLAIVNKEDWADFVFDDDYALRSLEDLKSFIEQNGHLPEMPTTQEVKENGYLLHQINKLLLQKVEELTLYTIGQEDQLNAEAHRVQELEAKVKAQETRLKLLETIILEKQ